MPNTAPESLTIHVAAGVILRDHEVLISKRHKHSHQGGLWEFPGGKIEPAESAESALGRELREELGIVVKHAEPMMKVEHDYGDKGVVLDVWLVREFDGEAEGREGQAIQWCSAGRLAELDFPAANAAIVEAVRKLLQAASHDR